jgi:hypothetical protein
MEKADMVKRHSCITWSDARPVKHEHPRYIELSDKEFLSRVSSLAFGNSSRNGGQN